MGYTMNGFSGFGNSPIKQDKKAKIKDTKVKKYRLVSSTKKDGTKEYFKISGGKSTDGGKTFTPTVETNISEAEYKSYFPKKKKGLKQSMKKIR